MPVIIILILMYLFPIVACDTKDDSSVPGKDPKKKSYFCPNCQEELFLTLSEILRHKRTHS